jgi:hypothetical protein
MPIDCQAAKLERPAIIREARREYNSGVRTTVRASGVFFDEIVNQEAYVRANALFKRWKEIDEACPELAKEPTP